METKDVAYLDTETTGLGYDAEIIQIGIIDGQGNTLFESLVKCESEIDPHAQAVHGISKDDLQNAPTWLEIYKEVACVIQNYRVINIYNEEFDCRMIDQTSKRYGVEFPSFESCCVMELYARFFNDGRRAKLINACLGFGIDVEDIQTHSVIGDCELTRRLDIVMLKEIPKLLEEQERERNKRAKARAYRRKTREEKLKFLPKNRSDYPYFATKRPVGSISFSSIKLKDMGKYEFLGSCCDTYGNIGLLMKLKNQD